MRTIRAGSAVRVTVPGSSANLGPCFDSVGLALGFWDEYDLFVSAAPGLTVDVSGEGASEVPVDETHLVLRSLARGLEELGASTPGGLRLVARNGVPHGRGLGSSATAIVAGVVAAQALWNISGNEPGAPLAVDRRWATNLASVLEGHPDNASASMYGGMTLSWTVDDGPLLGETATVALETHPELTVVVFLPENQLATHAARAVLPDVVAHRDAALNAARAALLVEAVTRRPDLLLPATRDWLHQEARRGSFPASMALLDDLRARGHAAVISGAGPSVLVLTTTGAAKEVTAREGAAAWRRLVPGIPARGAAVTRL